MLVQYILCLRKKETMRNGVFRVLIFISISRNESDPPLVLPMNRYSADPRPSPSFPSLIQFPLFSAKGRSLSSLLPSSVQKWRAFFSVCSILVKGVSAVSAINLPCFDFREIAETGEELIADGHSLAPSPASSPIINCELRAYRRPDQTDALG